MVREKFPNNCDYGDGHMVTHTKHQTFDRRRGPTCHAWPHEVALGKSEQLGAVRGSLFRTERMR